MTTHEPQDSADRRARPLAPGAQRVHDLLARQPIFDGLPAHQLDALARQTRSLHAARGQAIVHRGDPCLGLHLIVYGQVKLFHASPSGQERVMRLIRAGEGFGEALMFLQQDHLATAEALRDTLLLFVAREAIVDQLDQSPQLARRMIMTLSRNLYMLMGDMGAYTLRSGTQRLIGFLLRESHGAVGVPFRIEVGKGVIASRLNMTPAHLSRILNELGEQGLIQVHGREITIVDVEGLRTCHG